MSQSVKPIRGSTEQPDHIMLSIKGDAATSMTVTWRTCTDINDGYVLYREDGSSKVMRADAATEVFKSDIDISNMFWADLTGLKPDTKYFYTCGNDKHRSEEFYFSTAPENLTKFKFLCVSDQQKGEPFDCPDYSHFNGFVKEMLEKNPDTRFILTGGDNTDCGQHEVQWNGAFSGLIGISEHIPFMMTLGNHDNRGFKDYKNAIGRYYAEPAEFFDNQFKGSYAYNGPENWKTENYTFDYGNVHFAIIGINGPEEVNEWLIKDLDACDKQWKIGSYHFPICYSGSDCQNYDAYPVMREGMEKLDILFSGHEHNFSRSFPVRNEEIYDRPSQGTIHYMLGNSNLNPPGTRAVPKVWHSAFYSQEEMVSMVVVVEVDGPKITLTAHLNDGRIADRCVINKETDSIDPPALAPIYNTTRMKFKGMDLGLCQYTTPCEFKDGIWFAPLSVLVGFIGGEVRKTPGKVYLDIYGHNAEFTLDSDVAQTDRGELKLPAKVYRGKRDQLYIPLDGVKAFEMRWAYAPRNNFVSIEHESEDKPITVQP